MSTRLWKRILRSVLSHLFLALSFSENNPQGKLGSDGTMGESCNVDLSLVKEEIEVEDPGPSEPYTDLVGVVSEGYNDVATPMDPPAEEQDQKPMETDLEDKKTPEMILTDKIKTEDTEMAGQFETVFVDPSTVENDETTEQNSELSNIIFETNEHGIGMPIFCRLCATRDDDMIDIFGMDQVYRNIVDHYLPVTVKTSDYLPKKACRSCIAKVTQFHNFYETVADAQKQFSMLEEKILSQIKNLKNYPKVIPQCNGQLAPNENSELEFIIKPIDPPPPKCYGPVTRARKKPGDLVEPVEEKKKTDCLDGETDIIKCRICGRFFGTPKSCYSHSRVHACNGYVPCSMCDEIFTNRKDAHIHSWDHILPLTTQKVREMMKKKLNDLKLNTVKNVKGMIYVIEENRKAEEEAIKNSGVRCRICSEVFLNTRACYRHSISHAQENYHPCCMCNKNFTSKTEALVHSLEHVTYSSAPRTKPKPIKRLVKRATIVKKISPDPDLEKYLTNRNVKLIDNVTQNEDDGDDDRDMVKCRLCGLYFGTGKSCYAHSAVHNSENYYPCSMCEASFTNKKDSYTHSIKHTANKVHQRRAEMIRRNGYIEPVTPVARIIMEQIMEKHGVVEIKRNEQSPSPSDPESDDDMVKCRLCGLYFGTGKSCYTHSAVHFSENYYPCSMCDETFTTRKESYEHSYMHTVTKPQLRMSDMIRQRGTIEPMKVNEDNDVIEINEGESTAQGEAIWCRFCGKFFKSVLSCYKHAKAHYSRRKYPCCMCDKDFTTLGESYVHSLSHQTTRLPLRKSAAEITDGGNVSDEGIQCSVCKIYLKSAASFHSHCYSHISTDNFPCCICDKSFKTDVEYCFHSIRHSSESSGAKEGKISIPICNKCGKRFPTDDRLKFHKIYHDPRTKPCYCRRCDKNFASESSLYDHIQTVHTEPTGEFGRKRCPKYFEYETIIRTTVGQ